MNAKASKQKDKEPAASGGADQNPSPQPSPAGGEGAEQDQPRTEVSGLEDKSTPASGGTDGQDARPTIEQPAFTPAIGRVVLVRSQLYGKREHDAICEEMLEGADDRARVKLPVFEPQCRPGRILKVWGSDGRPMAVDVVVDIDPSRDLIDQTSEIVREQPLYESRPPMCDELVVFVPPRV